MANNNALYNAAFSGALGGTLQRWITNTDAQSYTPMIAACIAFATAVDAAIPVIEGGASDASAASIQSICNGVTANRMLTSSNPVDYTELATAIAAAFTPINEDLLPPASITRQFSAQIASVETTIEEVGEPALGSVSVILGPGYPESTPILAIRTGPGIDELWPIGACVVDEITGEVQITFQSRVEDTFETINLVLFAFFATRTPVEEAE